MAWPGFRFDIAIRRQTKFCIGHATHLLEDNKDVAMANAVCGIKVILIDCPYNRTAEHDNITRVSGWDDIYKIFLN